MSQAFRDKWLRMSAGNRLTTILTYLAKQGDILIPEQDLEAIEPDEGISESFNAAGCLVLHYAPQNTKLFTVGRQAAIEKGGEAWPDERTIPSRLENLLEPAITASQHTTLDDAEMAAREQSAQRMEAAARQARVMRGQPLPVTQPKTPPM